MQIKHKELDDKSKLNDKFEHYEE